MSSRRDRTLEPSQTLSPARILARVVSSARGKFVATAGAVSLDVSTLGYEERLVEIEAIAAVE